jgi:RNA recognition motif-containing protein
MSTNLYVGNLPFQTTDEELQELFAPFGEVASAKVIYDRETGRSRGFGFVEMVQDAEAQEAIEKLDQKEFMGRPLKVNLAKPREPRRGNWNQQGQYR